MSLVEKVQTEIELADYHARECMGSRRKQIELSEGIYCMLSYPSIGIYCPLQGEKRKGVLVECLRKDYLRELINS